MIIKDVAVYNPLSIVLFSFENEFVWGGSTKIPSDTFAEDGDCPFPDGSEEEFQQGQNLTLAI